MSKQRIHPINLTYFKEEQFKVKQTSCIIQTHDNKILLQRRGKDFDTFPDFISAFGGKIEVDETPIQAVVRELNEELGAKIKESEIVILSAYTELVTHHTELVYGYFWHDKNSATVNTYSVAQFGIQQKNGYGWT